MSDSAKWWKNAVVYQIYPRSFMDSNGDGIGDIRGIESRLGYLRDLGVDVIWVCPVYKSPNVDNGYDISDYRDIQADFGTLQDMYDLIAKAHENGIRVVMDMVINHTSDMHPWFLEARKSKDNPKHDYYLWVDPPADGSLPNNWQSHFSGPAWKYVEECGQYYLHIFSSGQPDLNWENPELREELKKILVFWLDKGIDGFRLDTINFISKVPGYPSVPGAAGLVRGSRFYMNGPKVHDYLQEIHRDVFSKYDIMTVGETPNVTPETAKQYVAEDRGELSMVFQFEHVNIDQGRINKWDIRPWSIKEFKSIISKWQSSLGDEGWNSIYVSNHDQARSVSRFGNDDRYLRESAKLLCTMDMTLRGTPYVYQGEELGMTNVRFPDISFYRDVQSINLYRELKEAGVSDHDIMEKIYYRGRDNARTPMQWDATRNAGFTDGRPWIDVNPNYTEINAEAEKKDPDSVLNYYKGRDSVCDLELERSFVHDIKWDPHHAAPYAINASEELYSLFSDVAIDGITLSAVGFYAPQGRWIRLEPNDTELFTRIREFRYNGRRITNCEMEGAAIAGMSALMGHRAGTMCVAIAQRAVHTSNTDYTPYVERMIQLALDRLAGM